MNKYELIFEEVQESLNNGKITLEEAEALNDYAYDKYISEETKSVELDSKIVKGFNDKIKRREEIQTKLMKNLKELNKRYEKHRSGCDVNWTKADTTKQVSISRAYDQLTKEINTLERLKREYCKTGSKEEKYSRAALNIDTATEYKDLI